MNQAPLKAPFPYFGGKSKVADLVWARLGDPDNYAEPFAGSIANLLRRPKPGKIETINDTNHYVVNFWRAVSEDPEAVAEFADWPVTEADLHARHRYLVLSEVAQEFRDRIAGDPEYFDPRFAGWWVWGQCCWIGSGWCDAGRNSADWKQAPELGTIDRRGPQSSQLPDLAGDSGAFGRGVASSAGQNKRLPSKQPILNSNYDKGGTGVHAKAPRIDGRGTGAGVNGEHKKPITVLGNSSYLPGVHGEHLSEGRPQLGDAYDIGRGVNGNGSVGLCGDRREWLLVWMRRLQDRLRLVRKCYGQWHRICDSRTTMTRLGTTGVFLDPPYAKNLDRLEAFKAGETPEAAQSSNRSSELYAGDRDNDIDKLVADVNRWCQKWGPDPNVRIALCGYEGEHDNLETLGWDVVAWKDHGGYGNRNTENENKHRERIWFSPGCGRGPKETQQDLF